MNRFDPDLLAAADALINKARTAKVLLASAESCTGGMIGTVITEIAGSSDAYDGGFITYSNHLKSEVLGVSGEILDQFGAVSEPVARAMAEGALARSSAQLAVSVTGIAGPGGSEHKPAGLVHFGLAGDGMTTRAHVEHFGDIGRSEVRRLTTLRALALLDQGVDLLADA